MNHDREAHLLPAAYHEAGHAVVARVLGLRCGRVELFRRGDVMGQAFIQYPLRHWKRGDGPRRKLGEMFCVALYAGAEAEKVLAPNEFAGCDAHDLKLAVETLNRVRVSGSQCVGDGAWKCREAFLRRKAKRLVMKYLSEIRCVGNALWDIGYLEGYEVDAMLRMRSTGSVVGKTIVSDQYGYST